MRRRSLPGRRTHLRLRRAPTLRLAGVRILHLHHLLDLLFRYAQRDLDHRTIDRGIQALQERHNLIGFAFRAPHLQQSGQTL